MTHTLPGRQISRFSMHDDRTLSLMVFEDRFVPPGGAAGRRSI